MSDLSDLTGQPVILTVDGRQYEFYPLTVWDLGRLQEWINSKFQDPLAAIRGGLEGLSVDAQKYAIKEAIVASQQARPRIGTPEADALLSTTEGMAELVYLVVRHGDRSFTREQADELLDKLSLDDVSRIFRVAYGMGRDGSGPKGQRNGEERGTTPRTPTPRTGGRSTTR